jgi:hypothetical protein
VAYRTVVFGIALVVAACAGPTEPTVLDLEGAWSGSVDQPEVHLQVTLVRGIGVMAARYTGTGTLWGAGPRVEFPVAGIGTRDSISLRLEPDGFVPIRFVAAVAPDGTSLVGMLDGSGIRELPIRLERQP